MPDTPPAPKPLPTPPTAPRRDATFYLALAALLISVVGTIVSVVDTSILRDQQLIMQEEKAASVWPYIDLDRSLEVNDSTVSLTVTAKNKGIGPAIVSVGQYLKGDSLATQMPAYQHLMDAMPNHVPVKLRLISFSREVLQPEEEVVLLETSFRTQPVGETATGIQVMNELAEATKSIEFILRYCSVYGECWEIDSKTTDQPEKCTKCSGGLGI